MHPVTRSAVVLLAILSVGGHALAQQKEAYSEKRFAALQKTGEVVLIDVFAPWCPTCVKQQAALMQYRSDNPDKHFVTLVVDYDNDREAVRFFRAPRQSTLLIYKGGKQLWFSVAETRPEVISAELDKAVAYSYQAKYAD